MVRPPLSTLQYKGSISLLFVVKPTGATAKRGTGHKPSLTEPISVMVPLDSAPFDTVLAASGSATVKRSDGGERGQGVTN